METVDQTSEISAKKVVLGVIEWYKYLLLKRKIILIAALIFGCLGWLFAWISPPIYNAEYTFVLEDDGENQNSQYAGLASMLGVYQGGGAGGGLFKGENIIDIYESRRMVERTLLTRVPFQKGSDRLITRYLAVTGLRDKWDEDSVKNINFNLPEEKYSRLHDSIMGVVIDNVTKGSLNIDKKDNKENIISVKVRGTDETFTYQFAEKLVDNVNAFYVQTKTKKSAVNLELLKSQADSLRRVLGSSMSGAVASIDANPNANPAMQSLQLPSQKRQIDIQSNAAIYSEIVKNIELSRMALRKETPLIEIIDSPVLPLKKDVKSKIKYTLGFAFIGAFLVSMFLLSRKLLFDIIR